MPPLPKGEVLHWFCASNKAPPLGELASECETERVFSFFYFLPCRMGDSGL